MARAVVKSVSIQLAVWSIALIGCGDDGASEGTWFWSSAAPLQAFCTAQVTGVGNVDVEGDYLPHVVACENGSADLEALRAQAVAARTYLYYKLERYGRINDGTSDQVYTCRRSPGQAHYDAVASTAGEVLTYRGGVIAAFYVAGAIPSTPNCIPTASDNDPTNTERWVTYNAGQTGSSVTQTPLGWVDPRNHQNRGCKSQNGAHCLSLRGRGYDEILGFYYGADIVIEVANGTCVNPPPPADAGFPDARAPDATPRDAAVVDAGGELDAGTIDVGIETDAGNETDVGAPSIDASQKDALAESQAEAPLDGRPMLGDQGIEGGCACAANAQNAAAPLPSWVIFVLLAVGAAIRRDRRRT